MMGLDRIRIERLRAEAVVELVQKVLADWGQELQRGVVLTVEPGRIRLRQLPLPSDNG